MKPISRSDKMIVFFSKSIPRVVMLLLVVESAACNLPSKASLTPAMDDEHFPSASQADATPITPEPLRGRVLLHGTSESSIFPMDELVNEVEVLANESGLDFSVVQTLTQNDIDSEVIVVIVVEPDPGLVELIRAAPNTQFLAIGVAGFSPSENLSLLGPEGVRPDRQAFIAGYIAAMIATDWRVGVVAIGDQAEVRAAKLGFLNGARYFCGLCNPAFPPFLDYPQSIDLDSVEQGWGGAKSTIEANEIQIVYLTPIAAFESQIGDLLTTGSIVMGDGPRPDNVPAEQWVATIQYDVVGGLRSVWNDLVAGNGGLSISLNLQIKVTNTDLLSPGKERLAIETLDGLEAGFIDTDVDPPDVHLE